MGYTLMDLPIQPSSVMSYDQLFKHLQHVAAIQIKFLAVSTV